MIKIRTILVVSIAIMLLTAPLAFGADEPIKMGTVLRLSIGAEDGIPFPPWSGDGGG